MTTVTEVCRALRAGEGEHGWPGLTVSGENWVVRLDGVAWTRDPFTRIDRNPIDRFRIRRAYAAWKKIKDRDQ